MPIYEYYCSNCEQEVSIFFRHMADAENQAAVCPTCGGQNLTKRIGRVVVLSSARRTQPGKAPSSVKSNNPRDLARLMREASSHPGKDFGEEFKEVAHRLEKGESAKQVEKTLRKRAGQPTEEIH